MEGMRPTLTRGECPGCMSRVGVGGLGGRSRLRGCATAGRGRGAARGGEGGVFADELFDALVLFANERQQGFNRGVFFTPPIVNKFSHIMSPSPVISQ